MNTEPLMSGRGLGAVEPFDLICGGCGISLVSGRTWVEEWVVRRDGWVTVDEVEHFCDGDLTTCMAIFHVRSSSEVRDLERSVGIQ